MFHADILFIFLMYVLLLFFHIYSAVGNGLLPARASEQGNVIGSVRIYIYIYIYMCVCKKKNCN